MSLPSVKLLAAAMLGLLNAEGLTVYPSRVDPVTVLDNRGVVKGYAILHPLGPGTDRTSMSGRPGSLLAAYQVDCVGGSHDYVLGVVDSVIDRVDGKTLIVAGAQVGLVQPPFGYQPLAPYRDPGASPFQLRLPLQYQVLAVPA